MSHFLLLLLAIFKSHGSNVLLWCLVGCWTAMTWLHELAFTHTHMQGMQSSCKALWCLKLLCMIQEQSQGRRASSSGFTCQLQQKWREQARGMKKTHTLFCIGTVAYIFCSPEQDTVSHGTVCTCSSSQWPWIWSVRPLHIGLEVGNTVV